MYLILLAETVADLEMAPMDLRRLASGAPVTRAATGTPFEAWFGGALPHSLRSGAATDPSAIGAVILPLVVTEAD